MPYIDLMTTLKVMTKSNLIK